MNATPNFGISMISEVPSNPQLTLASNYTNTVRLIYSSNSDNKYYLLKTLS